MANPSPPSSEPRPPFTAAPPVVAYGPKRRHLLLAEILFLLFVWMPLLVFFFGFLIWGVSFHHEDDNFFIFTLAWLAMPVGVVAVGTLALLALNAAARAISSSRQGTARAILGYLENAVRLHLPLDRFLQAAEESEREVRRQRLISLRAGLQQGLPVGAALQVSVPEIPASTAAALSAAESIGQLRPALFRLMTRDRRDANSEPQTTPFYRFYFPLMLVAIVGLISFVVIFIAPKFRDIFKDFHTTLPPLTQWLFDLGSGFSDSEYVLPALLWILVFLSIALAARVLQRLFQWTRGAPRSPLFFGIHFRWIPWYIPLWRELLHNSAFAAVMEFLADALRSGMPLSDAVDAALPLASPAPLRRQFEHWHQDLLAGQPPATAARDAGLPHLLVGFLETGSNAATTSNPAAVADVFEFLARYYRERYSRRMLFLRAAAEPVAALVLGIMVGTVVLAIFLPLVKLINTVMQGSERGFL